ncbi:head-tail connector protein [Paenibacillus ginsengarvi]|uniref:Phage gp6-like head-tail connector protein n=1 Tax=Paenibacillus ginsengarvi TaxID=400777 RepID=A0A3B0CV53_9BACL|nr:head-tail connector protein [Paenibacillus ginsengarvi]RKN86747.1 hypothetical protein D7M11_01965 [Paenibacillus ginsengarvi]
MAGLKVITPPPVEPVTLGEVKTQLRIDADDTDYDDILSPLIVAAREWCEGYQNRAYITQTLELALDEWPCKGVINLPRPELQSVTSLTYFNADGASAVWPNENYVVDDYSFVARLVKAKGVPWPSECLTAANGIRVRYVAGYGDSGDDVPQKIKQAIMLLTIHWYENGMCDPPPAVKSLLQLDRVMLA